MFKDFLREAVLGTLAIGAERQPRYPAVLVHSPSDMLTLHQESNDSRAP